MVLVTHSLVKAGRAENEFGFTDDNLFHDKSLQTETETEATCYSQIKGLI